MNTSAAKGKKLLIMLLVLNISIYVLPVFSAALRNAFLSMGIWAVKLIMFIPVFAGYIWARNIKAAICIIDIAFAVVWLFPSKPGEIYAPDAATLISFSACVLINLITVFLLVKSQSIQLYLYEKRNN